MAKSKRSPQLKRKALELAKRGFTDGNIAKQIGISRSTLYSKNYKSILDSIRNTREKTKNEVFERLIERSDADISSNATILLSEKLHVFTQPTFKLPKPKTATDALNNIASIIAGYSTGDLDSNRADKLIAYNKSFISAYDSAVTDERIAEIEKTLRLRKANKKGWT